MSQANVRNGLVVLGPDDPPVDFSREQATYDRELERLVREHLGKIALVHGDQLVGVFCTADEAMLEAFRRFGTDQVMVTEIEEPDVPAYMPLADLTHPSIERIA